MATFLVSTLEMSLLKQVYGSDDAIKVPGFLGGFFHGSLCIGPPDRLKRLSQDCLEAPYVRAVCIFPFAKYYVGSSIFLSKEASSSSATKDSTAFLLVVLCYIMDLEFDPLLGEDNFCRLYTK